MSILLDHEPVRRGCCVVCGSLIHSHGCFCLRCFHLLSIPLTPLRMRETLFRTGKRGIRRDDLRMKMLWLFERKEEYLARFVRGRRRLLFLG